MKRRPMARLGSPGRVTVTKVIRTSWRIEWEYDGMEGYCDETGWNHSPARKRRTRHMQGRMNAYRAAAMRYIFMRRDCHSIGIATDGKREGCKLCETKPVNHREDPQACKYHDGDSVELLRYRLARWMMWRDGQVTK
jgi:hypothetical protein